MVANKVRGIRCALCWNEQTAVGLATQRRQRLAGQRMIDSDGTQITQLWLERPLKADATARIRQIESPPVMGIDPMRQGSALRLSPHEKKIVAEGAARPFS